MPRRRRALVLGLALCVIALSSLAAAGEDPAWGLLRAGTQVILVRHAATDMSQRDDKDAPLADCSRQRNLTDAGRADARKIREAFRLRAIPVGRVLSSPYCRCLETARLAFGEPTPWLPLQSSESDLAVQADRTAEIHRLAGTVPTGGNLILVTHQFTIRAVTGVDVAEGEMLVLSPHGGGTFEILGRMAAEDLPVP
jgi:broad specificity phosphatase PhoE